MTPILETRELTKSFAAFSAVSRVSVSWQAGKIHAVIGENGAGKTTLMKLLFGLYHPTSGDIFVSGNRVRWRSGMDAIRHGLGMVQQHFMLVENLSVIDNIILGSEPVSAIGRIDRASAIKKIETVLPSSTLILPWHTKIEDLTVGQRQKVEILKLLFREARILFLDEPTAVLTPQEIGDFFSVLRALASSGRTIVLITHKIHEVFDLCDTFTVLRGGELIHQGLVSDVKPESLVEMMIGRKTAPLTEDRPAPRSVRILECMSLSEVGAQRGRLQGIDLVVHAGEIVGIAGVDGSGQANLVDAILNLRAHEGRIELFGESTDTATTHEIRSQGVALVPEDRLKQGLWGTESCYHNMMIGLEERFSHKGIIDDGQLERETGAWARLFDVRARSFFQEAGSLSGGNQQKLIFAREVEGRQPKFLICHQPTRGVDLGAIELIHAHILKLRNRGLGVLVMSSELDELLALSDRILVMFEGRITAEFTREKFDRLKIGAAMVGTRPV